MRKLFLENGLLSPEGEKLASGVRCAITDMMESDDLKDLSEAELRALQSNLAKMVGDAFGKYIARNIQFINRLNAMTNEEFYSHLKDKYGDNWILHSLEKEERARLPHADLQRLADEHQSIGKAIRKCMIENGVKFNE